MLGIVQQNMLSNATNHGSGTVSYFYDSMRPFLRTFSSDHIFFGICFIIYYMFDNFSKKKICYLGMLEGHCLKFYLFTVNKGCITIPLVLLSPILFVAFVNRLLLSLR